MHNFTGAGPAGPLAMGMIPTPGAGPMLPGGGGAGGGPMIMIPTPGGAGQAAGGPPSARGDKPGGLRSTGSAQLVGVGPCGPVSVRHACSRTEVQCVSRTCGLHLYPYSALSNLTTRGGP